MTPDELFYVDIWKTRDGAMLMVRHRLGRPFGRAAAPRRRHRSSVMSSTPPRRGGVALFCSLRSFVCCCLALCPVRGGRFELSHGDRSLARAVASWALHSFGIRSSIDRRDAPRCVATPRCAAVPRAAAAPANARPARRSVQIDTSSTETSELRFAPLQPSAAAGSSGAASAKSGAGAPPAPAPVSLSVLAPRRFGVRYARSALVCSRAPPPVTSVHFRRLLPSTSSRRRSADLRT